ncbi:Mediator of RNA polymerase II transcription subunit-like protein [Emericellopsis cladophorae]|uniref:Mediator of RNA polymerase II transcription subunit 13 n=1 Tax=Emericellopsis cladophorae TaxID=2686198 RepID=A0A9Q0BH94_9HYPO|nr:Mediator of RNA polymerase II transcription subunit-like protein [Emericellopsis cladophorae]KAI6784505.1 Mediator of RNA polymerase II transcription subunit-like protein [Emericellopsis cladophorae]
MLDSLVSSPKNLVSSATAADLDGMNTDGLGTETDIWGQSEFSRERSDSNVLSDQDNMLIGGDIFGDNDVTEDDFRFFDEQPDEMDLGIADYAPTSDVSPPRDISKASTPKAVHETPAGTPMSTNPALQDADVFKKPELKHARSYMSPATSQTVSGKPVSSPKREGSPFSPEAVFKRVRGSLEPPRETSAAMPPPGQRRGSIFDKVDIGPALPVINKKYEKGGIFSFDPGVALTKNHVHHIGSLPETDYLRRHSRRNRKLKELPTQAPAAHMSPFNKQDGGSASDEDASSVQSEEDDTSYTSDEAFSPAKATFRRGAQEDDDASQVTSLRDAEAFEESEQHLVVELPRLSKPVPEELPLARIFADPEPMGTQLSLADETLVAVAQVLTEQASTGFVDIGDMRASQVHPALSTSHRRALAGRIHESLEVLHATVPACFTGWTRNSLKGLLDLPDVPLGGQAMRMGMSNRNQAASGQDGNVAAQLRPSSLYPIPYHRLEVRRAETSLSVLPTAVSFWDSLGLAPASGGKEVQTLCMFPRWTGMQDNVRSFLESMGGMYELLKLGSFVRLRLSDDMEPGMIPFEVDRISTSPDASVSGHGSALLDSMTALQSALAALPASEVNIAVLMVYSPGNPTSIVEACLAFQQFTDLYAKQAAAKEGGPPGLTLQLVSIDLISSATTLVVPSSTALAKLCLELYDRCAAAGGPSPAPAIVLEQPLPRVIDFKLTSNPSASLIHENSCFHVSYACSQDERWVSAAWTDDRGTQQSTASYCLGRKGRPLSTTMHEVAHEIWETTLDMIAFRKIHWRLIITKVGNMDNAEIDFWSDLMRTESRAHVAVILMTVDTNPSLQLVPPSVQVAAPSAGFYTTPVSTPQGSMVSPEQVSAQAAPPTPTATDGNTDPEADAILLDLTDQTFGAVVGHRLNVSQTPLELQPSLVSGFLIKKTSKEVEEPPVVMEVNLVHTEGTGRPYEPLLREMLNNFRGLNTLARSRGVVDKATDVRPWHVAAAEKAVRALYMLL